MTSLLLQDDAEISDYSDTPSAYPPLPEDTLEYEQYMIGGVIRRVRQMIDRQPALSKSREYYEVMEQVLMAMDETVTRMEALRK